MRLVYQSFGQESGMEVYRAELRRIIAATTRPGTEVILQGLPSAALEGKGYSSAQALELGTLLRVIGQAVSNGANGIAIGNGFDPGLWEARELFDVPVLGWFETLTLYALRAAWRVGVLCSGRQGPSRMEELAARYGIAARMVQPVAIGITVPELAQAYSDETAAQQILQRCDDAAQQIAARGGECLIVASGLLDVFLESQQMASLADLPMIPGVPVLIKELEAAAELREQQVCVVSRVGRFASPPKTISARIMNSAS